MFRVVVGPDHSRPPWAEHCMWNCIILAVYNNMLFLFDGLLNSLDFHQKVISKFELIVVTDHLITELYTRSFQLLLFLFLLLANYHFACFSCSAFPFFDLYEFIYC